MRRVAVPLLLALAACSSSDPDWAKPCAQQRPPSVKLGNGQAQYLPIGTVGVPIEVDTTGTYVWLAVSCTGFGPDITVSSGIEDASGTVIATQTSQAVQLGFDSGADRDEAAGLAAQFTDPTTVEDLIGTKVTLFAEVSGCGRALRGTLPTTISGYDTATCQGCLDEACLSEVAVCDSECVAIQACLDAYCVNLSANASPDEVTCQAYCQSQHPTGKQAHIALVTCVQSSMCQPPCNGYSIDYDACVAGENTGACAAPLAACNASSDCSAFKTCVTSCTSWSACQACGAKHPTGESLSEKYQDCIEGTCLTLGWLPHLSQ